MITTALYSTVADVMARIGIEPISQEEILANRRVNIGSGGRRKTDGLGSFMIDHFILDLIEVTIAILLYSFFTS